MSTGAGEDARTDPQCGRPWRQGSAARELANAEHARGPGSTAGVGAAKRGAFANISAATPLSCDFLCVGVQALARWA